MRIGIDATCWANERGYGRFTRELVGAMVPAPAQRVRVPSGRAVGADVTLAGANVQQRVGVPGGADAGRGVRRRRSLGMLRLTNAGRRERWTPSPSSSYSLPPGLPGVVTVHDAIAERFPELTLPRPGTVGSGD
jgi:alpha-1,3-rhamnosyl/mannosyltransferase